MQQFIKYLKFLLTSTNQYGVHSPFVYSYLTKCLYRKSKFKAQKTEKVLLKSIVYFNIGHISIPSYRTNLKKRLKKEFPSLQFEANRYDMILVDVTEFSSGIESMANRIHNDTAVIIDHIHKNAQNEILWDEIKNKPQITVTLDMFYCGVVFFRREQVKEHFKIRL